MSLTRRGVWAAVALSVALGGMSVVHAQRGGTSKESAVEPGSKGHGKMVFVLTTGVEDLQTLNMAINHSGMAKKSGYLDDSILLVYGRAVQAFSKNITAKPPQVAKSIKEAKEAGVRILVCGEALKRFDIAEDKLEPGVEGVVPNSITTLAELVSKGYQIVKY